MKQKFVKKSVRLSTRQYRVTPKLNVNRLFITSTFRKVHEYMNKWYGRCHFIDKYRKRT